MIKERNKKGQVVAIHGGWGTRLYRIWQGMKNRCHNKNDKKDYKRYGARGIRVCDEWRNDFSVFREWAYNNGYKDDLLIDRIDNERGYYPENCRWVNYKESAQNRRTTKLTEENVIEIRNYYSSGEYTYKNVGDKYGISSSYAWQIINKKRKNND